MRNVYAALALIVLAAAGNAACATGTRQPRQDRGRVTVGVTSTGNSAAMLTFRVSIEPAGINESVRADAGVLTRGDVPPGEHVVRLSDVPTGCRIDGGAERRIVISSQRPSAVVRYAVRCD